MHHIGISFLAGRVVLLVWDFFWTQHMAEQKILRNYGFNIICSPLTNQNTQIDKVLIMIYSIFPIIADDENEDFMDVIEVS